MRDEHRPDTNYRGIALLAVSFAVCSALVYGATIWLIFWLVG